MDAAMFHPAMDQAVQRMGGRYDVYERLLRQFLRDLPRQQEELQQAFIEQDRLAAQRVMHTLKGVTATLGLPLLPNVLAAAESQCKDLTFPFDWATQQAHIDAILAEECMRVTHWLDTRPTKEGPLTTVAMPLTDSAKALLLSLMKLVQDGDISSPDVLEQLATSHAAELGPSLPALQAALDDFDFDEASRLIMERLAGP